MSDCCFSAFFVTRFGAWCIFQSHPVSSSLRGSSDVLGKYVNSSLFLLEMFLIDKILIKVPGFQYMIF